MFSGESIKSMLALFGCECLGQQVTVYLSSVYTLLKIHRKAVMSCSSTHTTKKQINLIPLSVEKELFIIESPVFMIHDVIDVISVIFICITYVIVM